MRQKVLYNLRNLIKSYIPSFTHIIGVKDNIKQSDYPFISYVYTGEQAEGNDEVVLTLNVYFGILQKDFDKEGNVFSGQIQILDVIEAIKLAIYSKRAFAPWIIDSYIERIETDGGFEHPRYHGEMILKVRALEKLPEPQVLVKRISVFDKENNLISEVESNES